MTLLTETPGHLQHIVAFSEARRACAAKPVTLEEMLDVLDRLERRETGARERAMGPVPNPELYREPVVLEALLNLIRSEFMPFREEPTRAGRSR
jgi:hypothetical protein